MYEKFGAVVTNFRVAFSLFLPDNTVDPNQYVRGGSPRIQEIHVCGDFQNSLGSLNWQVDHQFKMQKVAHPNGWLYQLALNSDLPEGYYQYKYVVEFENGTVRWVSDPITKYGGNDDSENSAFVIGGNRADVQPIANRLPARDLIIYETHLDDFTAQYRGSKAPVDAFRERLDYLQELGVNAIEFMPWTAWPGNAFNWGYAPFSFFSVEYSYINDPTTPADKVVKLKNLINDLHQRGLHVILDGVFNHVEAGAKSSPRFAYKWLYQNPDDSPFIGNFAAGGFFDELDYQNNCVEEFIRDVCIFWLDQFQIDGIRFDFTRGFFQKNNPHVGITKLISNLNQRLTNTHRSNIGFFIEHLPDNRFEAVDDTNHIGATGCWFDPFMFKHFEYCRAGQIDGSILRILNANLDFQPGKSPVTYIQNHDHSSITHQIGGRGRWFKTQPAAIALLTSPGAVMIHNGQEFGQEECIFNDGPRRVAPRPLRWEEDATDETGRSLFHLYQKLITIRKEHPALCSANFFPYPSNSEDGYGAFPNQGIVIYHRWGNADDGRMERFIIVLNYSDADQQVDIPFSTNGQWSDLLNNTTETVTSFKLFNQTINSNWGRIYFQKE